MSPTARVLLRFEGELELIGPFGRARKAGLDLFSKSAGARHGACAREALITSAARLVVVALSRDW